MEGQNISRFKQNVLAHRSCSGMLILGNILSRDVFFIRKIVNNSRSLKFPANLIANSVVNPEQNFEKTYLYDYWSFDNTWGMKKYLREQL